MFVSLQNEHCDGWPSNQVAVNPEDLTLDRIEFPIKWSTDDLFTMVDASPNVEVIKAGVADPTVLRVEDVVVVVNTTWA